jgi:hypothetical protein
MARFVTPETVTLHLSDGDTITIRRRLNTGEQRAMFAHWSVPGADGKPTVNWLAVGPATVGAYLLDWSVTDPSGAPVVIKGQPYDVIVAAFDHLEPEDSTEIRAAIDAHIEAEAAARAEEKKTRNAAPSDGAISPSPFAVAGASSGSAT